MKKLLFSLMAVALAIGLMGGAFAYFSDTATSDTNSFTSGILSIDDAQVAFSDPIVITNMAPGDVTGEYSFIIKNNGTINLAWLGDWQFTAATGAEPLYDALYIADAKMEFITPTSSTEGWLDDSTSGYETGTYGLLDHFITNGVPSGPYPLAGVVGSFGVVTFNAWNNNPGMVPGSVYEHAGALKPNYSYKLTVKFGMAAGAGNAYQGLGPVTAKLKVDATQIVAAAITPYTGSWADITWLNNQIADQIEP